MKYRGKPERKAKEAYQEAMTLAEEAYEEAT
jgi:hypothetical protein